MTMINAMIVVLAGVVSWVGVADPPEVEKDPILRLYSEYRERSDEIRNDLTVNRRAFYEEWLARFQDAIAQHPDSSHARALRGGEVRALLYSLGRYREALDILDEMVADAVTEWDRATYLSQMGLVAKDAYLATKDRVYAQTALDAFERIHALDLDLGLYHITAFQNSAYVRSLADDDHLQAAELYMAAHDALVRWLTGASAAQRRNWGGQPDAEDLLWPAAKEYARADRPAEAVEALKKLDALEDLRQPMTHHLRMVLSPSEIRPTGKPICDYAASWLAAHPEESHALEMRYYIAHGYREAGAGKEAIRWFESLLERSNWPDAPTTEQRRLLQFAVRELQSLYHDLGDGEKAEEVREMAKHLTRP